MNGWAEVLWAIIGLGLIAYAVSGGADLGAGLWSLLASGPRKREQQDAVKAAIAPIWEANHVWLIFVIVLMFSAFSRAFAAIGVALHVPLALALLGIVFRGAAYVFSAYGIQGVRARAGWDRVFSWASLVTPIFLGMVIGGVSSGAIRIGPAGVESGYFAGWATPFGVCVGLFSLALFAMLAAVYLSAETRAELAEDFRTRAVATQAIAGVLAAATFALAQRGAPALFENMAASALSWPVQLSTAAAALATVVLLLRRRFRPARFTAAAQVALVVVGWGVAMRGHFILPDLTLERASTNPAVMPALVAALGGGAIVLIPALIYLYRVFKRTP